MDRLDGKVAVITGAASGLGRACAERFVKEGAQVVIADIQQQIGETVAAALPNSQFVKVDVSDPNSVEALIDKTMHDYGCLDILVNNAGIDGEQALIVDSSIENWRRVLATNQDGVYFGMKYGIAAMLKGGRGVVLNMASIGGMIALENFSAYTAAKGAVIQLTRTAAIEYAAHRIRVNALCPTIVNTPLLEHAIQNSPNPEQTRKDAKHFNPLPGMPTPDDVAAAALFLASDEAAFITGVALPIDGGYTAR
ncbi:SDR family oxidoreductase [Chroococcidiopsis sp. FACHB-1243]|uniref:SDR family NAD(P)-dependent oxidoreductase n=1 Tax=Chroococcidiopsis sp. [FACHB-1243] TaxID=2692781 RepID=UPI00177ECFDC|nr:SDR family oxidoreductase [Chroococcidiopsis sp. [FACHB-1243]]MBD2309451.1 SDR family oxidoreductase [Chroococcidiopsis sp. [FACHB-1243]]